MCEGVGGTPGSRDEQQNFHYNDDDDDGAIRPTATTCFNIAVEAEAADRINLLLLQASRTSTVITEVNVAYNEGWIAYAVTTTIFPKVRTDTTSG